MTRVGWAILAAVVVSGAARAASAEREAYWWLDEIRAAAWEVSRARTGAVAQWPRMAVPAGAGTLPLPPAAGAIALDGCLDEDAWEQATSFPVGPVFGPWREGPFVLRVRACRDDSRAYLGIESPRDLTDLASLAASAELFTADRPYRVGEGGGIPAEGVRFGRAGQVVEIAVPLPEGGKPLSVAFASEVVSRPGGAMPAQLARLGLTTHGGPVWLGPTTISLVPSEAAVEVLPGGEGARQGTDESDRLEAGPTGEARGSDRLEAGPTGGRRAGYFGRARRDLVVRPLQLPVVRPLQLPVVRPLQPPVVRPLQTAAAGEGVWPYVWEGEAKGQSFRLEGFLYVEPVAEVIRGIGEIAARADSAVQTADGGSRLEPGLRSRLKPLLQAHEETSPSDRESWRALYCRARALRAWAHLSMLDAPLLFVKQHPYFAGHIYDDYYTWHPGGGIYVLENPAELDGPRRVRAVIDAQTPETLGAGVYRDPDLWWDARRLVFAYKPDQSGMTSIYEIGIDGAGLRRLTESDKYHDITPAYLPDGRIVFSSTRPGALVPCFNSGVDTLHTMNAEGSGIRSISSNNVTEFDPAVLPDGRILYGRWEYLDKTALYMQSLWTMLPDGTGETALFANNRAKPTAVLDARPVPGSSSVVASLTPHNGQAAGAIGIIDPARGKNDLGAIVNFTPEYPAEMDQGLTTGPSDPWALSEHDVIIANNAIGRHGIIELIDRHGHRELVHCDPGISCYAPMPVKARAVPPVIPSAGDKRRPGRFLVLDVYRGLTGVGRGEVKRLRVIEETARVSGLPPGGRWWNQAFLTSWQGAYVMKTFLGTVPVHADGSAYFEAPPGRALYLEALDEDGREVQRMRTFVQAVPGVTRACIGCHEAKQDAPEQARQALAARHPPARPEPESWGNGYVDYPTMIQPVFDRHCVRCHGGEEGMEGGIDLSGGWTWAFSISYETLLKRDLAGFLRCHNSDVSSSDILPPRTIGSGAAPLGDLLVSGHQGRIAGVTRAERDLVMAWMDGNSNYYGTWDYTQHATCEAILRLKGPLTSAMQEAGCVKCHQPGHIGSDWVNLKRPEWSRIVRAPLAKSAGGLGLQWCRKRAARAGLPLVDQRVMPPDRFHPLELPEPDLSGEPQPTFASADDPRYRGMLRAIRRAAAEALGAPRVDMPGAAAIAGVCRFQQVVPLPDGPPKLHAALTPDGAVQLSRPPVAEMIGLRFELHRGTTAGFTPGDETRISDHAPLRYTDYLATPGTQHYALVAVAGDGRGAPGRATVDVPTPTPPPAPEAPTATPLPGEVLLSWDPPTAYALGYRVYRSPAGDDQLAPLTETPLVQPTYSDGSAEPGVKYAYVVRAVDRRGVEGAATAPLVASPLPEIREPVFEAAFTRSAEGSLHGGGALAGALHGRAGIAEGVLDLRRGGHVTFPHRPEFDIRHKLSMECWVYVDEAGDMPVFVACGHWPRAGWFLQRLGSRFRWHVGGVDCDAGTPAVGRWLHLVGTFDGRHARVFQDGKEVGKVACSPNRTPWPGPLFVGQYSATPGPQYQVTGRIAGVRIYQRALSAEDVAERHTAGRPQ